jgi:HAMP domain-containing protein
MTLSEELAKLARLREEVQSYMVGRLVPTTQRIFQIADPFVAARQLREFFDATGIVVMPQAGLELPSGHVVTADEVNALTTWGPLTQSPGEHARP